MSDIRKRKLEHIKLSLNNDSQSNINLFEDVILEYKTLPELDYQKVDTSTELLGKKISHPLIIGSMTGGVENAFEINKNLAIACEETNTAFGVGSQRIALENIRAQKSFKVIRKYAPTAVIFANMGAVQLNYGYDFSQYQKAIDMIKADALFLHTNALQEALQPEGDTNFDKLIEKIEILIKRIDTPVFIKEVGHGIDCKTAKKLDQIGVAGIDISGVGGTSWAWIEAKRSNSENLASWFKSYGYKTDELLKKYKSFNFKCLIMAGGGIRSPIQGLKAIKLGAKYYCSTASFLSAALSNSQDLVNLINEWKKGLKVAMFTCGYKNIDSIY